MSPQFFLLSSTLCVIWSPATTIIAWISTSLSTSSTCLKPWSPPPGRRRPCSRGTWEPLGELTNPSRIFLPFLKSYRIYISITSIGFDYSELHLVVRNSNSKSSPGIHWSFSMLSSFPLGHSLLYCSLLGDSLLWCDSARDSLLTGEVGGGVC